MMGWFRRRRRAGTRVVFLSAAGAPVVPMYLPPAVPAPAPPGPPDPCVRLGFADGTELRLPSDDPAAREILATADLLALGHSAERRTGR
jgi:hypothetical protein